MRCGLHAAADQHSSSVNRSSQSSSLATGQQGAEAAAVNPPGMSSCSGCGQACTGAVVCETQQQGTACWVCCLSLPLAASCTSRQALDSARTLRFPYPCFAPPLGAHHGTAECAGLHHLCQRAIGREGPHHNRAACHGSCHPQSCASWWVLGGTCLWRYSTRTGQNAAQRGVLTGADACG